MKQKSIYIIDGNSLLFRAYYATAYGPNPSIMQTKDGIPTNAIFAFSNMLTKLLQTFHGEESIFVGFDTDSHTFRKEEFEQYKANRKPAPEELIKQFPISRELLDALGIVHYEEHGIEADDICGTIAKLASKEGYKVEVYTSDKDYLQLIDENVTVNLLKSGLSIMERMTPETMVEKWGFEPLQIIDYKGLCGDPSDNLPGIPGIGDKTAAKLIKEYGSFPKIIEASETMGGKLGENIRNNKELGEACYRLARIKTDAELPFSLEDLAYDGYDYDKVSHFAQKYELRQLLQRLPISLKKGSPEEEEIEVKNITSFAGIKLGEKISISLDLDSEDYHDAPIYGIAVSSGKENYYEAIDDLKKDEAIKAVLEDSKIKKNVYDGKMCLVGLNRLGIALNGVSFDLLLAAYLLDSSTRNDPVSIFSSLGVDIREKDEGLSLFETGNARQCGKISHYCLNLEEKVLSSLRQADAYHLYEEIEFPLSFVLAKMEIEGFPLDGDLLSQIGLNFREKVKSLEKEIHEMAGYKFNISSPKQVAELLYNKMGLDGGRGGSTSVDALNSLAKDNPIVAKILEYRKYSKLVGTYIDGLLPHIHQDGKIHTIFNQAQTTTGRLSSSNPNMQNISTRDEEGKSIKKAFFYPNGEYKLLSLDYSQIELRILAALSHCQSYIDVFAAGHDVHSETAKKIFKTEEVTPLMRRKAKAVNFAIIYGTTAYGLSEQIGDSPREAKAIIDNFYEAYPEIGRYLSSIIEEVERKGFVTTMFGRRRYLRDITDSNYAKREAARRQALNAPVQGSAADLIKLAMLHIDKFLEEGGYKTRMVLQIHDELLFKVPKEEEDVIPAKLKELMENAIKLPVKLTVEGSLGNSWYEAKD